MVLTKICGIIGIIMNFTGTALAIWNIISMSKERIAKEDTWETFINASSGLAAQKAYCIIGLAIIFIGAVHQIIALLEIDMSYQFFAILMLATAVLTCLAFLSKKNIEKWAKSKSTDK